MNNVADNRVNKLPQPIPPVDISVTQPAPIIPSISAISVILFIGAVIVAEIITVFVGVLAGAIIYGFILVGLTNLYYFSHSASARSIYLGFTLLPLLRILSLVLPVQQVAPIFWYVMIGLPLLFSAVLVARVNGLTSLRFNLPHMDWFLQILFSSFGIPLGMLAVFFVPRSALLINQPSWWEIILEGIILTIFGALTEEIIFRGIMQKSLSYSFGFLGVILTNIIYSCMFLGTLSPGSILFFGFVGLLFGLWVQVSDSLWGVIIAHSLMNFVFILFSNLH